MIRYQLTTGKRSENLPLPRSREGNESPEATVTLNVMGRRASRMGPKPEDLSWTKFPREE